MSDRVDLGLKGCYAFSADTMSEKRELRCVEEALLIELESNLGDPTKNFAEVLGVLLQSLSEDSYIVYVAEDHTAAMQNPCHQLLERSWGRCKSKKDPLKTEEPLMCYKCRKVSTVWVKQDL
ncbi:unnamed protein product, partial [Ixodes hexagonus]